MTTNNLNDEDALEYLTDFVGSEPADLLKPGEKVILEKQINGLWRMDVERYQSHKEET